jgi:hypothetical protein
VHGAFSWAGGKAQAGRMRWSRIAAALRLPFEDCINLLGPKYVYKLNLIVGQLNKTCYGWMELPDDDLEERILAILATILVKRGGQKKLSILDKPEMVHPRWATDLQDELVTRRRQRRHGLPYAPIPDYRAEPVPVSASTIHDDLRLAGERQRGEHLPVDFPPGLSGR